MKKHFITKWRFYLLALILIAIFSLGATTGYLYFKKQQPENLNLDNTEKNIYIEFLSEIYDKIKANYWEKITDEQLGNIFKLGIEKLAGKPQDYKIKDKNDFEEMLSKTIKIVKEDKKETFVAQLANIVLVNLKPLGRSSLYLAQDKENLKNRVQNINPETDLYKILELNKEASENEIEEAYENKIAELEPKKEESEEAKKEFEETKYAYEVLSNSAQKQRYDEAGIEPTVLTKLVRPDILHLYIKKISPTTFDELKKETEKFDSTEGLDSLILDLRSNVGGSIDMLPYLLGPFIGQNQYAYDFFHQEEYTPFKTKIGWLPSLTRYKKVVILINDQTQSSAEIMAATFKKYNVGILIGTTTKGWGTIESVTDVEHRINPDEKYSIFLVHSLTLRDDNQPIEGNGVDPIIYMDNPDWEQQLFAYFHYDELTKAVREIWNKDPGDLD